MTETEAFAAIEKRRWAVYPQQGGGWVIDGGPSPDISGDADVWEIARTRGSLVTACEMAKAREDAGRPLKVK